MPELPEVETVRAGLAKHVIGRRILTAQSFHPRAIKHSSIAPISTVAGAKITAVKRRGKFLWFELDRDFTLVAHLGMSGQLLLQSSNYPAQAHLRAKICLSGKWSSGKRSEIRFIDQRTFGWLSVELAKEKIPTSVAHIALDPFEAEFDLKAVISKIRVKKSAIKPALLNQEIISGIGNIYADEALWRAKIHPEIICEELSDIEIKKLPSLAPVKHGASARLPASISIIIALGIASSGPVYDFKESATDQCHSLQCESYNFYINDEIIAHLNGLKVNSEFPIGEELMRHQGQTPFMLGFCNHSNVYYKGEIAEVKIFNKHII